MNEKDQAEIRKLIDLIAYVCEISDNTGVKELMLKWGLDNPVVRGTKTFEEWKPVIDKLWAMEERDKEEQTN